MYKKNNVDMNLILFIVGYFIFFFFSCVIVYHMEENVPDDKPIKKWWRKYIIGVNRSFNDDD